MAGFSLLFLDGDAPSVAEALERQLPGVSVTPCTSLVAARAHLVGSTFDAILAAYDLPDGPVLSLQELAVQIPTLWVRAGTTLRAESATAAGAMGFVAALDLNVLVPFVAWHAGLASVADTATELSDASAPEAPLAEEDANQAEAQKARLERVGSELGHLTHALNNPLAVISGNAQLVRELVVAAPDDPMVLSSIGDISIAAGELAELIEDVNVLRRSLTVADAGGDETQIG